jgi:hypothetical protein
MRRITVKHAQPGMVAELPVYDNWGNLLLNKDQQFDTKIISQMTDKGVTELLIRDPRMADVVIAPLFTPQTEGVLAKAFKWLVMDCSSKMILSDGHLSRVKAAMDDMVKEITKSYKGDVNVSCRISPKDYAYLQPVKTAGLALAIGSALKLPPSELFALGMAAILKDVCLPIEIIDSVDCLIEGGSPKLRDHPRNAYHMLSLHRMTAGAIATAVSQHHEKWSGTGYPKMLKGADICRHARIIAIADAFVDLLSDRPGRGKFMSHEAIEYIMAGGGDQFDPDLVKVFVQHIPSYPAGLSVQLNSGETGIVSNPKLGFVARPIVRICYKPAEGNLANPFDVDLSRVEFQRMLITKILEYN